MRGQLYGSLGWGESRDHKEREVRCLGGVTGWGRVTDSLGAGGAGRRGSSGLGMVLEPLFEFRHCGDGKVGCVHINCFTQAA